ncbi:MAG: hypothetical protein ACRDJE_09780 [Dehalococcoidia bacterium]
MTQKLMELSPDEFEALVERAVDRRLQIWLTQLMDILVRPDEEDEVELQPEFAAELRRSMEEADRGEVLDLESFQAQLER